MGRKQNNRDSMEREFQEFLHGILKDHGKPAQGDRSMIIASIANSLLRDSNIVSMRQLQRKLAEIGDQTRAGLIDGYVKAGLHKAPSQAGEEARKAPAAGPNTQGDGVDAETAVSTEAAEAPAIPAAKTPAQLRMFKPDNLKPHPVAKDFFRIREKDYAAIRGSMSERGFDQAFPLLAVGNPDGSPMVIDGLSRLRAAVELGIPEVPVMELDGMSDQDIELEIVNAQVSRRQCTDAELLKAASVILPIEAAKARARRGTRNDLKGTFAHEKAEVAGTVSDLVGLILHRSGSTVDKIKKILASPEYRLKVENGELGISAAYREIMAAERARAEEADSHKADAGRTGKAAGTKPPKDGCSALFDDTDQSDNEDDEDCGARPDMAAEEALSGSSEDRICLPRLAVEFLFRHYSGDRDDLIEALGDTVADLETAGISVGTDNMEEC